MKKILILVLLFCAIGLAQNIPVTKKAVYFYADSIANFDISRNLFLGGVYVPRGKTTKLDFKVYNSETSTYHYLTEDGTTAYSLTIDSSKATYVPLKPIVMYPIKEGQIIINKDPTDTLTVWLDLRPY